jgi:predicted Zn-dependent protease
VRTECGRTDDAEIAAHEAAMQRETGTGAAETEAVETPPGRLGRRSGGAFALAALLVGCGALTAATGFLISYEEEALLGAQLAEDIELELVLHPDPEVQRWLREMGEDMLAVIPNVPREYRFTFQVVDDPGLVNAFAAPGGPIYFYSGLILAADTESEVAGVLGHEIAHVTRRHGAQSVVTQFGLTAVLDYVLGGSSSVALSLLGNLGATGAILAYSRQNETEADEFGLRYVVDAGWNPNGLVTFFRKLDAGSDRFPEFLSTHPAPGRRAAELERRIGTFGGVPNYDGDPARWQDVRRRLQGGS